MARGIITEIQRYAVHDGTGIRTMVFLKGCPLRCSWCANPETQNSYPELYYKKEKCQRCLGCLKVCQHGAIEFKSHEDGLNIKREVCAKCEAKPCTKACYYDALQDVGRTICADELLKLVMEDHLFYRNSGGGVTLSGGEPLYQSEFAIEFLMKCREKGINTAIETCGVVDKNTWQEALKYADFVFIDLKHVDDAKHKRYTGIGNHAIKDNIKLLKLSRSDNDFLLRIPLVPGFNTTTEDIDMMIAFLQEAGIPKVQLLPHHNMGLQKYSYLMRDAIPSIVPLKYEELKNIRKRFYAKEIQVV